MRDERHTVGSCDATSQRCRRPPRRRSRPRRLVAPKQREGGSVDILVGGFTELSSSVFPQPRHRPSPACRSVPKSQWVTVGNTFENFPPPKSESVRVSPTFENYEPQPKRKNPGSPDRLGEDGAWMVEDWCGTSRRPQGEGTLRGQTIRAPIQAVGDGGVATTPVRARPRALRYDSMPCLRPIQPTATNGHLIAPWQTSDVATTLLRLCGRGQPRSRSAPVLGR
jgi:hypothetical protein